jgi:para-nitrobenzyl esterase
MDQTFVFGTTAQSSRSVGTGRELVKLERMMMATWAAFAHAGNPDNPTIPHWPRYDAKDKSTMMFNVDPKVERDPGGKARASLDKLPYFEYSMPITVARHGALPPNTDA